MNKIKEKREALGLTQEQLSEKSKVHRVHISNIENDKREANIKTYKKLAKALNCDVADLI